VDTGAVAAARVVGLRGLRRHHRLGEARTLGSRVQPRGFRRRTCGLHRRRCRHPYRPRGVPTAWQSARNRPVPRRCDADGSLCGLFAMLVAAFPRPIAAWRPATCARQGRSADCDVHGITGRPHVHLTAAARVSGRSMHFAVREPDGDLPLFLSLQVPGPPASVLCGVMSGVAFVAHESLPSACRIVFIRVPDTPRLNRTNRYFESHPGAITADLADLGGQCARGRPPRCAHAQLPRHQCQPGDATGLRGVRQPARPRAFRPGRL